MGQNLIMNIADHGYKVLAFNRTVSKVDRFLANEAKGLRQSANNITETPLMPDLQENPSLAPIASRNSSQA